MMIALRLCLPTADPLPLFHPPNVHLCQCLITKSPVSGNPSGGRCPPPSSSPPTDPPKPPSTTRSRRRKESAPAWLTVRLIWLLHRDRNFPQIGIWTTSREKGGHPRRRCRLGSIPKENLWYPWLWALDRGCLPDHSFLCFLFGCGRVYGFPEGL